MSGPVSHLPGSIAREMNAAIDEPSGWDFFKTHFLPAAVADTFRPDDQVLKDIARLAMTEGGARILAWLHDLTDRAPYPMQGATLEETALAAARHQGRAGVGHVLRKARREGDRLLAAAQQRSTTQEG